MATERIHSSGKFIGTIKKTGGKYVIRTALAIETGSGEELEYNTRQEAYNALVTWSRS